MMTAIKALEQSDIGDNAMASDLAAFQRACELRNRTEDETEEETVAWMWGQGDWIKRVVEYVKGWNPDDGQESWGGDEERAEAILSGDCDYA